ncbi:4-hydroxybenzoate octaprenyltransferase [Haematobacter massiliensis]|uniref:4-hydroxybenzoate octaprenyltransferase n=1 Tax=Haematobacter massiliensis TaxID=195105 RepID=A0A086YAR4_9RHOB|nr:4-hydroxybenzoate octaprenyltransferase [Haematobacter massiliensis]KFI31364.1 4-hydroxybenzoate polyprenyltransferase [Haematobacter massiliensis]OWJ73685.1 4-hydroxybenzoate octaprenyltransferase [Haematobacter massiliensis]OWJ84135.1 4-hydroxybenzoate octaprenyltransferase [Haematobacter massiliensis]QBJ23447.1 4-hydroxybenzoate octaprenyltransferase [Haematobacter massiliensis]
MTHPFGMPEADGRVADAVSGSWVDTRAPRVFRPYLRLSRADRPIGTWLLYLPMLWSILLAASATRFTLFDLWLILASGVGAILMRGAGCTWNDITDRDFDGSVARTRSRPIPSGQVTVRQAAIWMGVQAGIAALILFTFNWFAIALGVLSLGLVAIYPFAKRFTWWPQVFLGLAFNWGALLGWAAHMGSLSWAPVFLYLAGISWTLFYDTIYAHQDKEDDALIGVKSTARLFGEDTHLWLTIFLGISVVLMSFAFLSALGPTGSPLKLILGLAGVWCFGFHLWWQLTKLRIDDSELCLRLFRSNRDAGLIPALFLAISLFV